MIWLRGTESFWNGESLCAAFFAAVFLFAASGWADGDDLHRHVAQSAKYNRYGAACAGLSAIWSAIAHCIR